LQHKNNQNLNCVLSHKIDASFGEVPWIGIALFVKKYQLNDRGKNNRKTRPVKVPGAVEKPYFKR